MDSYLSTKIKVLSFLAIIGVVFLHSQMLEYSSGILHNLQKFITGGVTRVCVPMFFALSGYLFARGFKGDLFRFYRSKLHRRWHSLVVPYLLWNGISVGAFILLQLLFPSVKVPEAVNMDNASVISLLKAAFIDSSIIYPLWFIRDLFLFIVISPVCIVGIKYLRCLCLIALYIASAFHPLVYSIDISGLLFFCIGMYFALRLPHLLVKHKAISLRITIFISVLWIAMCIGVVFVRYPMALSIIMNSLGILAIWCAYDFIERLITVPIVIAMAQFSFFIFVAHEPMLTIIKKTGIAIAPANSFSLWVIYLCAPLLTISCCILIGNIMKKKSKSIYNILTGGR